MRWVVILQNGRGPPAPEVVSGEWRRSQPSSSDKTRAVHVLSLRPGKLGAPTRLLLTGIAEPCGGRAGLSRFPF